MGRPPSSSSDESGLKKGPWTPEEDEKLIQHITKHGHTSWRALPRLSGLNRCGKSCRLRWTNYLRPDIKRGKFSQDEEQTILNLHATLGNKWSAIATRLPGRTDNGIKNFWNTHLKKKLVRMGFDPMTHRPRADIFSGLTRFIELAKLLEAMDVFPEMKLFEDLLLPELSHAPIISDHQNVLREGDALMDRGCKIGAMVSPWTESVGDVTAVEGCSASSYGSSQMWSELLDDHMFNEIN